uniref:Uncharacterized protein n=1 Tax=Tanacetum cinerariifolium TaxID=118510 RepID=A0A6L2MF37_TANCI|nr:hypothetical protein [Tanacetum cinerariifolium]
MEVAQYFEANTDTSITPPTAAASPRLTAFAKGKQTAKASKAKSLSALSEVAMTEAQQLKLVTKQSMQQTHISQPSVSGVDEGTGDDNEENDADGDEEDKGDDGEEGNGNDDEDDNGKEGDDDDADQEVVRDDDKYDDEEDSEDEGDGEEDLGLNIGEEERHVEKEKEDELYRDVNINQGRGIQATIVVEDSHVTLTLVHPDCQQESSLVSSQFVTSMLNPTSILRSLEENFSEFRQTNQFAGAVKEPVKAQVSKILPRIEQAVNEQLEAEILPRSSHSSRTSYVVAADLYEMELKKILIEKMEGNKETITLKRRQDDDADKDEEPFAGLDRGSKRHREGKEHESVSASTETTTRSAGRVDTLTPELLVGPTYELMKGSCKSLIEPEYHMEEVYKATTDQLDWVNPKGQQYPQNLLQPLPLIPNNRGRRVIPFEHFINNDLEYLRRGASSRKYTTFIMKTKAADYGHIKWIEDLVPRTMWIIEPIGYDQHALWGRRVENLQLGVKSYQKRLNLTKLDPYRSDLKRKEAYTAYSNPHGFIYQNKDKRNRLIRINELHKFSDGTLINVRTALDDRLKGIRMQYLPQSIWRKSDKDKAAAMI